jgi:Hint domain
MFMQDIRSFCPADFAGLVLPALGRRPGGGTLAATLVETPDGWRAAGSLSAGSPVGTWDGGFRPVARVERTHLWPMAGAGLIRVPGGALGACSELWLMPAQQVLIASPVVEEVLDAAGVLIPAAALAGHFGIRREPLARPVEVIALDFDSDEVVFANSGVPVHCGSETADAGRGFFPGLDGGRARALLDLIGAGALTTADLRGAA